jgi:transcriptional/translational regulatory protein YebC/TACO1
MELALECGGEDMIEDGDDWVIFTAVDQLFAVGSALQARGVSPKSQTRIYQPSTTVTLSDEAPARSFLKLYDALDDYDDTQNVHANFEISDEIADKVA